MFVCVCLFVHVFLGLVPKPTCKMEKKGKHKERAWAACSQLPPDHMQWRAHGPRGNCTPGAGTVREEEAEAGKEAAEVAEQTSGW